MSAVNLNVKLLHEAHLGCAQISWTNEKRILCINIVDDYVLKCLINNLEELSINIVKFIRFYLLFLLNLLND